MRRPVTSGRLSIRPFQTDADFAVVVQTELAKRYNATHLTFQEQPLVARGSSHVRREGRGRRQLGIKNERSVAPEFHLGGTGRGGGRSQERRSGNCPVVRRHSDLDPFALRLKDRYSLTSRPARPWAEVIGARMEEAVRVRPS